MLSSVTNVWVTTILLCNYVCQGTPSEKWDPLPAGIRNVVSSNHLGETSPPQVFAEYHALLPNYRGDYGIKSELVDAASEEPIYKGADTILLPLYIPRGAVPLRVNQRRVRSGKADGIANMKIVRGPSPSVRDSSLASAVNRPVRRVLPAIRRTVSITRPFPTPPSDYLRSWLKKRNGSVRPVADQEDNIEEAKRSKRKLLTQTETHKDTGEGSGKEEDSSSTESIPKYLVTEEITTETNDGEEESQEKRNKESVRVKKIMKRIGTRSGTISTDSSLRSNPESQSGAKNITNETFHRNPSHPLAKPKEFDATQQNYHRTPRISVLSNITNATSTTQTMATPTTTKPILRTKIGQNNSTTRITTTKPNLLKIIRRRPVVMNKAHDEYTRVRMRPVVPTRNLEDGSSSTEDDKDATKLKLLETSSVQPITSSSSKPIHSSLRIRNSHHTVKQTPKTPDWLQRRREALKRERDSRRQAFRSSEKKGESESIIDRVLNSAGNKNEHEFSNKTNGRNNESIVNKASTNSSSTPKIDRASLIRRKTVLDRHVNETRTSKLNFEGTKAAHSLSSATTEAPVRTTSSSIRQRIPIRLRRPIVSNPVKSTTPTTTLKISSSSASTSLPTSSSLPSSSLKTIPTTTSTTASPPKSTVTLTTSTTTTSEPSLPPTTTISTITDTTSLTKSDSQGLIPPKGEALFPLLTLSEEATDEEKQFKPLYSTNLITTSTPKLPFNLPSNKPPKSKTNRTHVPFLKQFNVASSSLRNINGDKYRSSQPLRFTPATPLPKLKSPQDIVLEKLSELMKDISGRKDNVDVIIKEIEKLNKELASMGIHIIEAEFNGHMIKLQDQIATNGSGINLSGATTIRYVIPNSNSRTITRNFQSDIGSHEDSKARPSSKISASYYDQTKTKTSSSTRRPLDRYRNNLTQEKKIFTLRPNDELTANITLTSPLPSDSLTSDELLSSKPSREDEDTSLESYEQIPPQVIVKPQFDVDLEDTSSEIYATITQSSVDTTLTRSTTISIGTTTPKKSQGQSSTMDSSRRNVQGNEQTSLTYTTPSLSPLETTSVPPTAHLRPAISRDTEEPANSRVSPPTTSTFSPSKKTTASNALGHGVTSEQESKNEIWDESERPRVNVSVENLYPLLISEEENVLSSFGSELLDEPAAEEAGSYIYLIGILGIVPCIAAIAILYKQRQKRESKSLPEREERADGITSPSNLNRCGHNDTLDAFPGYIFESCPQRDSPWELSRSKLRLTSVLGEGNFGMVWKAEARNLCDWDGEGGPTVLVAVKGVKEGAGPKEKSDLLREISIMQHLSQHANIVTLLGCCTTQEPYLLVMEYVMFGKLLTFLREQRSKNNYFNFSSDSDHLTSRDLTKFASQVATGCEYLQSRGVIHRDLAARNILVDHNKVCKIADFGLARSVKDMDNDIYEQKSKGPLPIRWMAPESLFMNIFTHKSDVWSFGILCWEIVTLGSTPYPGISAREVMRRVREGYRLERPEHCRPEFYKILAKCWHQDLNKRASFTTVKEEIRKLLENSAGWIDLENFQESTYYSMHQNNEEKL